MELELILPCSSLADLPDPKAGVRACLCMELGLPKNLCLHCREGKWGRAWSWAVAKPDGLQIPAGASVLLSNLECDRFASRVALVHPGHSSGSYLLVLSWSEGLLLSVLSSSDWAGAEEAECFAGSPTVNAECPLQHSQTPGAGCCLLADVEILNCSNPGNKSFWEWHSSPALVMKLIPELLHR